MDTTVKLRPTTPVAERMMPLFMALAAGAGLTTRKSVPVSVSKRTNMPMSRSGAVYLPASMTSMLREDGRGPIIFAHTFLHELQHALDFSDTGTTSWTRDDHEAHARAAERLLTDEQITVIVTEYRAAKRAHAHA